MRYLFINSIFGFVCQHTDLSLGCIYIDVTKKIAFLRFNDISITKCVF